MKVLNRFFFLLETMHKKSGMTQCALNDNFVHSLNLANTLFKLRAVSDMLGLKVLNHTGPITWGINYHFRFSSRVEVRARKEAKDKRKSAWHP